MRALILCAGLSRRLGDAAQGVPKPLIQINERPCVMYQISKLEKLGVKELMINTHKNLDIFTSTIDPNSSDLKISFSNEESLLGTLGTLKKHLNWLSEKDFWVMHGDNIFTDDLSGILEVFKGAPSEILGVMGAFRTLHHKKVGIVKTDSKKRLNALYEKSKMKKGFLANTAIYLFRSEIRSIMSELDDSKSDLTTDLLPLLNNRMLVYRLKGRFIDIGTPDDLYKAKKYGKEFALE